MDKKDLKKKYDELVAGIETTRMFDGRNKGVDVYVCEKCGMPFYTRYKDKGVTPFTIRCRNADGCDGRMLHKHTITETQAKACGITVHNWVRPTFEQTLRLNEGAQQHVLNGGLMLDDELNDYSVVREKFSQVQKILDSLQNQDATCLFIGHEGNNFVISGNPVNITAQIIFAMCRYPIVRDIIQKCVENFEDLNKEYGDDVRNIKMEHLIEINSGNEQ